MCLQVKLDRAGCRRGGEGVYGLMATCEILGTKWLQSLSLMPWHVPSDDVGQSMAQYSTSDEESGTDHAGFHAADRQPTAAGSMEHDQPQAIHFLT